MSQTTTQMCSHVFPLPIILSVICSFITNEGHTIAQAVSRRVLTAVAGFDPRPGHAGFVLNNVVLNFPCQFSVH
jgi:hypothetical protein